MYFSAYCRHFSGLFYAFTPILQRSNKYATNRKKWKKFPGVNEYPILPHESPCRTVFRCTIKRFLRYYSWNYVSLNSQLINKYLRAQRQNQTEKTGTKYTSVEDIACNAECNNKGCAVFGLSIGITVWYLKIVFSFLPCAFFKSANTLLKHFKRVLRFTWRNVKY